MSRSVLACRCGEPLGDRRKDGRLRPRPGVRVVEVAPDGSVELACPNPECAQQRTYRPTASEQRRLAA